MSSCWLQQYYFRLLQLVISLFSIDAFATSILQHANYTVSNLDPQKAFSCRIQSVNNFHTSSLSSTRTNYIDSLCKHFIGRTVEYSGLYMLFM